jgi:hypothetical protein
MYRVNNRGLKLYYRAIYFIAGKENAVLKSKIILSFLALPQRSFEKHESVKFPGSVCSYVIVQEQLREFS